MENLHLLTATQVRDMLQNNTITVEEYARSLLGRIEERNDTVKAWAFLGMPTQPGFPTCGGPQAGQDQVAILRAAGALIIGRTTPTEFPVANSGSDTANPHDPTRTPGGSSCGSAAAVADYQVPLSLGGQIAGGIIRPAAFTGVFAMKPTYLGFPMEGPKGDAPTVDAHEFFAYIDALGFFARSVEDLQLLADVFHILDGSVVIPDGGLLTRIPDGGAPTHIPLKGLEGLSVALLKTPMWPQAGPSTAAAMDKAAAILRNRGAQVAEVSLPPEAKDLVGLDRVQKVVVSGKAHISRTINRRACRRDEEIRSLVEIDDNYTEKERMKVFDTYARMRDFIRKGLVGKASVDAENGGLDAKYTRKEKKQRMKVFDTYAKMRAMVRKLAEDYSVILAPSAVDEAPLGLGDVGTATFNTLWAASLFFSLHWYLFHLSLTPQQGFQMPVVQIPAFVGVNGMPVGISLVAPSFHDYRLLRVSKMLGEALMAEGDWKL
ncbi:Amidase [Penicillium mononematosum]|uniref:Amidase n=1 Tax=Penicillium mononematosum TaxID=268346 RepID=UPI0025497776|nr:Amidase [Penicillium mononematosum]KAJ6186973.1 Amidase [Penicillium mononematosum]